MTTSYQDLIKQIDDLKAQAATAATAELEALAKTIKDLITVLGVDRVKKEIGPLLNIKTDAKTPATTATTPAVNFTATELAEFRIKHPVGSIIKKTGKMKADHTVTNARTPAMVVDAYRLNNGQLEKA